MVRESSIFFSGEDIVNAFINKEFVDIFWLNLSRNKMIAQNLANTVINEIMSRDLDLPFSASVFTVML